MGHHLGIGVQRCEWLAVGLLERAEHEARGAAHGERRVGCGEAVEAGLNGIGHGGGVTRGGGGGFARVRGEA